MVRDCRIPLENIQAVLFCSVVKPGFRFGKRWIIFQYNRFFLIECREVAEEN